MKYLNINMIKKHLNVDDYFHDDDDYIKSLGEVAEQMVAAHLDCSLEDILEDGKLPAPVMHAMLLLIGNMYQNREGVAFANATEIPHAYEYLLSRYKNYTVSNI